MKFRNWIFMFQKSRKWQQQI